MSGRSTSTRSVTAFFALVLLLAPDVFAGELRRWVDANGQVHISDGAPPVGARGGSSAGTGAVTTVPSAAASPIQRGRGAGKYTLGLLWRIEPVADGGGARVEPSYVFGTMHSADPRVRNLKPDVERTFHDATSFCAEATLDGSALLSVGHRMMIGDGRSLDQILGADLYGEVAPLMEARGMPDAFLPMLQPWVVLLSLSMPASATGSQPGDILDVDLMNRAQADGKTVCGLETLDEQIDAVSKIPERDLIANIRSAAKAAAGLEAVYAKATELYVQEDLAGLAALDAGESGDAGERRRAADFERRLLDDRNVRMVDRMASRIDRGGAFIAIGAGHLGGERGVLALLERRGYAVKRVTPVAP
ncbi:MAG: TraB/GumN family protein [Deltaproteobacteria bacterium]|nr:TraB/GumN family protein [Deltaproteobacteria bacterium]